MLSISLSRSLSLLLTLSFSPYLTLSFSLSLILLLSISRSLSLALSVWLMPVIILSLSVRGGAPLIDFERIHFENNEILASPLLLSWYLYEMVAQNMLRTYDVNQVFSEKLNWI